MREAQQNRVGKVNRCFGDNCPPNPEQREKERIKEVLSDAVQRRRANREIDAILQQFHGRKSIFDLLLVIKRHCSPIALKVAIERVERRQNELKVEDRIWLEAFKASLEQEEKE